MNPFQKQLVLEDGNMAELTGQHRDGVGAVIPPAQIPVEEFEAQRNKPSLLEVELRCNACDDVLIVHSVRTDDNGAYAYVEPCKKCAGLAALEPIARIENTMVDADIPRFFKRATGRSYTSKETCVNDIRRMLMLFWNERLPKVPK